MFNVSDFPLSTEVLVERLDKIIPRPLFKPGMDKDTFIFESGRRAMVEQLKNEWQRYEKDIGYG